MAAVLGAPTCLQRGEPVLRNWLPQQRSNTSCNPPVSSTGTGQVLSWQCMLGPHMTAHTGLHALKPSHGT